MRRVPNSGPLDAPIYLVGEAPGAEEDQEGVPFVGVAGQKLRGCLGRAGISEDKVRFCNLYQYRPPNNQFAAILKTKELQDGLGILAGEISANKPFVVGALGGWPTYYLTGKHGKKGPGTGIGKWRGSILPCILPGCEGIKVASSYHPAFIARQPSAYPIFDTDIKRIAFDSTFREFRYPQRDIICDPRGKVLDDCVDALLKAKYIACDIESVHSSTHILCHGFSPCPELSFVISHSATDLDRQDALRRIYSSPVPKIFHNGNAFDLLMLSINGFEVENYAWDTMIAQHVMWAELPKSLEYLTSVHTRQPYYKTAGRAEIPEDEKAWSEKFDKQELWNYNGTDTSVTAEIYLAQVKEMEEGPKEWKRTFDFTMAQIRPAMRISLAGMQVDQERREKLKRALERKWALNQFVLDGLVKHHVNVNSPKVVKKILYELLGLPPRRNREGNLTTDEDAIVSLISYTQDYMKRLKLEGNAYPVWRTKLESLKLILLIRGIRKVLSSYINVKISEDGRIRGTYKITGAETGRWSCAAFIDKTGTNSQTFPKESLEIIDYSKIPELEKILPLIRGMEQEDVVANPEHDNSSEGIPLS